MKFKGTEKLVLSILENVPAARNSDGRLYLEVIEQIGKGNSNKSISEILLGLEELGLPCFETVRRSRQKIQAEREDLRACDKVQDFRTEREEAFHRYYGKYGTNGSEI